MWNQNTASPTSAPTPPATSHSRLAQRSAGRTVRTGRGMATSSPVMASIVAAPWPASAEVGGPRPARTNGPWPGLPWPILSSLDGREPRRASARPDPWHAGQPAPSVRAPHPRHPADAVRLPAAVLQPSVRGRSRDPAPSGAALGRRRRRLRPGLVRGDDRGRAAVPLPAVPAAVPRAAARPAAPGGPVGVGAHLPRCVDLGAPAVARPVDLDAAVPHQPAVRGGDPRRQRPDRPVRPVLRDVRRLDARVLGGREARVDRGVPSPATRSIRRLRPARRRLARASSRRRSRPSRSRRSTRGCTCCDGAGGPPCSAWRSSASSSWRPCRSPASTCGSTGSIRSDERRIRTGRSVGSGSTTTSGRRSARWSRSSVSPSCSSSPGGSPGRGSGSCRSSGRSRCGRTGCCSSRRRDSPSGASSASSPSASSARSPRSGCGSASWS